LDEPPAPGSVAATDAPGASRHGGLGRRRGVRLLGLLAGIGLALQTSCSDQGPGAQKFTDQEKYIIGIATRALAQFEDWSDRADFTIERQNSQWHVTAWRVEHPKETGSKRYVPWGHREIWVDDAGKVVDYRTGK